MVISRTMQYNKGMSRKTTALRLARLLGPAFVAAVAYVDPGNFAANFGAGTQFGYSLLWVLVVANLMAAVIQYLSAKVGIVTGKSLPEIVATRLPRWARLLYWAQAELVAVACDVAEIVGGALALKLLFDVPLLAGGVIVGLASLLLLKLYSPRTQPVFERVIVMMLLIIPIGFLVGLIQHPPEAKFVISSLVPTLHGKEMVLLATAMVGATVMPHVIYLHSALARDRHGKVSDSKLREYLRVTKWDVIMAMCIAGMVNIAMLLLAASALQGQGSLADFEAIFHGIDARLGSLVAILFAVGLLISGVASTAVGSQAGSVIMDGLTDIRISIFARRCLTISPSLILLWAGANPSWLLLISQVGLSIGVPFALIPLLLITSRKSIMRRWVNGRWLTLLISVITILITLLNLVLLIGYI